MILDVVFVAVVCVWTACVGWRSLERLGLATGHPADRLALAITLGLGMLALATLGLGELGVLNRAGLAVVTLAGCVFGWPSGRAMREQLRVQGPRASLFSQFLRRARGG